MKKPLKPALRFHGITFLISVVVLIATVYLFNISPKGFLPSEDIGQISGFTEASQDISFDSMVRHQSALHEILAAEPAIETYMSSVGAGGPNAAGNSGRFFMRLKPRNERKESADELIQKLRSKLAMVPGIQAFLMNPPPSTSAEGPAKGLYQYTLQGPDTDELYRYAVILEKKMKEMSNIQDVNSDLQMKNPEIRVEINRDKASALGITASQIERRPSRSAYGSNQVPPPFTRRPTAIRLSWSCSPSTRESRPRFRCCISALPAENSCPWIRWPR